MNIKQLSLAATVSALTFSTATNAVLGPIPIYLNTEYRTDSPVIGSIASTLSFDSEDIKATGANTFLDFLATIPSVSLFNPYGNIPAVFMRGGHSDHTLILVDGVNVNSPDSLNGAAEYGLTSIALNDIEKIEIIKNSGSVLYGSSAVSGVINAVTKKGVDNNENTYIRVKHGTHNSKTYAVSSNAGNDDGFIRFTHNKYTTDGINAKSIDVTGEKDGIDNQSTLFKVGNKYFDISYLENRIKTDYDDGATAALADRIGDNKLNKITINANRVLSPTWDSSVSIAQIKSSRDEIKEGVVSTGDRYKRTDVTILNNIKINDAAYTLGLSNTNDENTSDNLKHSSKDLFINWQENINDVDFNAGIRHIKHNKFNNHTIYNLGLAKYFNNNIKLASNYNTAFQAPTLKEVTSGTQTNNLKPEVSKNINVSLAQTHTWGVTSLSLFKSKTQDRITYDSGWPNSIYVNQNEYSAKGIELSISANTFGYDINFDHTHSKSSDNNSNIQPVRRPRNISNILIEKQYGKFTSRAQLIRKSSSRDQNVMPGYTLLNLSNNYNINKNLTASLTIKNATNKNYITAEIYGGGNYNTLGRTIELGLEYSF